MVEQDFTDRIVKVRRQLEAIERGDIIATDEEVIALGEEIDRITQEHDHWLADEAALFHEAAQ